MSLDPGESRQVDLTAAPFGGLPTEDPAIYGFSVRAVPQAAPIGAKTVSDRFECRHRSISFDVQLSPEKRTTRDQGGFLIRLENRAETGVTLDLSAADAEGACELTLGSQCVELGPGESGEVSLRVTPGRRPPRGETVRCDFNTEAVPDRAQHLAKSVSGALEVSRRKARWGWTVAVLVLLALAGCLVAGLAYGEPWGEIGRPSGTPSPSRGCSGAGWVARAPVMG